MAPQEANAGLVEDGGGDFLVATALDRGNGFLVAALNAPFPPTSPVSDPVGAPSSMCCLCAC